jgi:hypothetical protein
MYPQDPGICTGSLCPGGGLSFAAAFGWLINSQVGTFGILEFTMDPMTSSVTVTTTPALITEGLRFGTSVGWPPGGSHVLVVLLAVGRR